MWSVRHPLHFDFHFHCSYRQSRMASGPSPHSSSCSSWEALQGCCQTSNLLLPPEGSSDAVARTVEPDLIATDVASNFDVVVVTGQHTATIASDSTIHFCFSVGIIGEASRQLTALAFMTKCARTAALGSC